MSNPGLNRDQMQEAVNAFAQYDDKTRAAESLGIPRSTLQNRLRRATEAGLKPDFGYAVPEGHKLKGVSTLYGAEGDVKGRWVKTDIDRERQEALLREAVEAMKEGIKPEKRVKAPKAGNTDLLNQYTVTDYHLGMLSWSEETGEDWDTDIAEDLIVRWFAAAIDTSPAADTAILAQLGDFLHWDGMDAVTPASKHLLDADTRFQRIVRVAIRVFRRIVRMLLEKHRHVHIIMAEGNHDPASSIWLRELFSTLYEDEPRVTIDTSPDPYYCFEHGQTSLFFHHGHKRRPTNIDDVFAAKFREVFGRTKHSYAHMGHLHHVDVKETNLMIVEQHRTLAAKDAYASRGGWMAGRDAKCITYHKEFGEVGRITINPEMIQ